MAEEGKDRRGGGTAQRPGRSVQGQRHGDREQEGVVVRVLERPLGPPVIGNEEEGVEPDKRGGRAGGHRHVEHAGRGAPIVADRLDDQEDEHEEGPGSAAHAQPGNLIVGSGH